MPSSKLRLYSLPLLSALALTAGCGRGEAPPPAAAPPNAPRVDAAKAGGVTGRVLYEGPAPANPVVTLEATRPASARTRRERRSIR